MCCVARNWPRCAPLGASSGGLVTQFEGQESARYGRQRVAIPTERIQPFQPPSCTRSPPPPPPSLPPSSERERERKGEWREKGESVRGKKGGLGGRRTVQRGWDSWKKGWLRERERKGLYMSEKEM